MYIYIYNIFLKHDSSPNKWEDHRKCAFILLGTGGATITKRQLPHTSGQVTPGEGTEGGVEGFGVRAEKGGAEEVSVAGAHFGV